jgi:hypothetical protein
MALHILTPKDQSTNKGVRNKILDKMFHTQVFRGDPAKDGNCGAQRTRCQSFDIDVPQNGNGYRVFSV